jgi:FkbM family methyltransferase
VIDGGANTGSWSLALLKQAVDKKLKKVVMIEPNDDHASTHQLLHENHPGIVSMEWVALGSQTGTMTLYSNKEGSSLASLYNREISHHGINLAWSQVVKVEKLADVVQRHQLDQIDFLKLDLEGHELEALKGAESLLENHAIRAIQFEFGGCNIDSRTYLRDFWQLLHDKHNYSFYRLIPNRKLMKLEKYSESLEKFTWQIHFQLIKAKNHLRYFSKKNNINLCL